LSKSFGSGPEVVEPGELVVAHREEKYRNVDPFTACGNSASKVPGPALVVVVAEASSNWSKTTSSLPPSVRSSG
jgi:hypothetical protein